MLLMQRLLKRPRFVALALAGAVALAWVAGTTTGTQAQGAAVQIDSDDIGGVVQGPNGPEAGVWVIAETDDLQTGFVRSVVTDDQGHFVVPDLPSASFEVWVRGYGLADSAKVTARPGSTPSHSSPSSTTETPLTNTCATCPQRYCWHS